MDLPYKDGVFAYFSFAKPVCEKLKHGEQFIKFDSEFEGYGKRRGCQNMEHFYAKMPFLLLVFCQILALYKFACGRIHQNKNLISNCSLEKFWLKSPSS